MRRRPKKRDKESCSWRKLGGGWGVGPVGPLSDGRKCKTKSKYKEEREAPT